MVMLPVLVTLVDLVMTLVVKNADLLTWADLVIFLAVVKGDVLMMLIVMVAQTVLGEMYLGDVDCVYDLE